MLGLTILSAFLAFVSLVSSTSILVPLYVWPEDDSSWAPVFNAISSFPDVQFQVIVNPNSGPGETAYPDENIIAGVAKLNNHDNVQVIGYVHTEYAERDISVIESQVSIYSKWASYKAKNITVSGIFFDEAPRTNDAAKISYMQTVSALAKSSDLSTVVFNPGTTLEAGSVDEYFKAADLIVEFENSYSTWTTCIPAEQFSSSKHYAKDAIILYSAPETADYRAVVREAQSMGLGAAYLTSTDNYMSVETVTKVAASFD